jgi:4-carboxymuconolactone decarboxylase
MKRNIILFCVIFSLLASSFAIASEINSLKGQNMLNLKQQSIIPIAAFTANGDIGRLKPALNQGLDAGLTVNEIKEVS